MLFVFDLDGVLYLDNSVIKGAPGTVCYLREKGHKISFATNNAMLSRGAYVKKLNRMGFKCTPQEVMASSYAAGLYLKSENAQGKDVFVIGETGLQQELKAAGLKVFTGRGRGRFPQKVAYVVVGLDRMFNYKALKMARSYIEKGAALIATNKDYTYPGKEGIFPGGGSLVAAVEAASGVEAFVIGKPRPFMLKKLQELNGIKAKEIIVVGDRYDTDIVFGKTAGTVTVMVLTGVTSKSEALAYKGKLKPDLILKSVCELEKYY